VSERDERQAKRPFERDHGEHRENRAIEPASRAAHLKAEGDGSSEPAERHHRHHDDQPGVDLAHPRGVPVRLRTSGSVADHGRRTAGLGLLAIAAVALGVGAIALGAFAAPGGIDAGASAGQTVVADVQTGHALFLQSCAACHGAQGEGGPSAPSIANAGAALTDFVLRTGRMPLADPSQPSRRGTPVFDGPSIEAIVAYVGSLGGGPPIPQVQTTGADLAAGRQLYTANCAACHGATGAGGAVGGDFVAPPLFQSDATTVGEAVISGPGPMPVFSLPPDQLNDLAAYVDALKSPPHPGGLAVAEVGPVAEGFLALFVGLITLLALARWIARGPSE
jgi:ubiquinol-cytochrome c reductase cytochrome c subunit